VWATYWYRDNSNCNKKGKKKKRKEKEKDGNRSKYLKVIMKRL
jgi:hypothetical protein